MSTSVVTGTIIWELVMLQAHQWRPFFAEQEIQSQFRCGDNSVKKSSKIHVFEEFKKDVRRPVAYLVSQIVASRSTCCDVLVPSSPLGIV